MTEKENKSELNSPAAGTPDDDSQSLEDTIRKIKPYIDKLWAKRKQFLIFNGVVAVLAVIGLLLFAKPYYTSTVSILPDYGNQSSVMSSLSGLASMAGINIGEIAPTEIYAHLLKSEKVMRPIITKKYMTEKFADSVNLNEYFEMETVDEEMPNEWQERDIFLQTYTYLIENMISTDVERVTTILTVSVKSPEPVLSAQVANNLVIALDDYITKNRQSYAREQSEYLFTRIKEVKDSLTYYEDELKEFSEKNRLISSSPQLLLEQNRLQRKVDVTQTVYLELATQYELIKLEEVKDAPVVNVMENAEPLIEKTGPRRAIMLIIIMFFSSILSGAYLIIKDDMVRYLKILY
ncbi:MAG: hypothetical protein HND52_14130 [Ignavibacteriae bacterium]|nr:hypothetical protein [Ignavibacteriota bacterium]NOG99093.1 hypothetical protein [Ignavibacteriota bacterium]